MPYTTQPSLIARYGSEELERYASDGSAPVITTLNSIGTPE